MKSVYRSHRKRHRGPRQRGSALLVSLMIMVGLSLLGLSFVAISETESAISANERNKTQTTTVSEAGAKTVVQWFQDPDTMFQQGLLPPNTSDFKIERTVNGYKGFYRPSGKLFDKPYGPKEQDMLFGDEEHADVIIVDGRNAESTAFIKKFNETLFNSRDTGKVTAIRVYAPPIVGGTLVNGFWLAGQRYGVATIAVVAQKFNNANDVIAQSTCRIVIAPFPLPGPTGAVQSVGGIATNGAYIVHWGTIESEQTADTYIKREFTSFPWFDAYDRAYIEYGLDSSRQWSVGAAYRQYEIVRPTDPAKAKFHEYQVTNVPAALAKTTTEPAWPLVAGGTISKDGFDFKERVPTVYPIATADATGYKNHAWFAEMLKRTVEDPWFQVRTRGLIDGKEYGKGPVGDPHPYDYSTEPILLAGNYVTPGANRSHYFQYQTYSNRPLYKEVKIPKFDYDFWKAAAIAGRGQKGVYYLEYIGSGNYSNGVKTQSFESWIAEGKGFFFFDTENELNPQNGGPGILVSVDADPCGAKGVVYMNAQSIKSTGCGGTDGFYAMPGEPYRDIGYRRVNIVSSGSQLKGAYTTDAAGNYVAEGAYDGEWSYEDLPWSNGGTAVNGIFDVCVAQRTLSRESTPLAPLVNEYVPLPYYPGCTVGNNITTPGCNCSEPFEPYFNLHYDGNAVGIQMFWDNPTSASSVRPKKTDDESPTGTPVTCTAAAVSTAAGQAQCATNAWDRIGGLAELTKAKGFNSVGMEGVLYNEGNYDSTGNAAYYGAVVVTGTVSPNGTQEIWFDACLTNDCWPPKHIPFPRVLITSTQMQ